MQLSICLHDQSFAVSANHKQASTLNKVGLPPNITQKVNQMVEEAVNEHADTRTAYILYVGTSHFNT